MSSDNALRLHIGGREPKDGWKILNIQPGENVDFVGDCNDLSMFMNDSVDVVYASHVIEHLDYQVEISKVFVEIRRILKPGGMFMISVPDLDTLCKLFTSPELNIENKFHVMRIIFGGHTDKDDYHYVGLNFEFLHSYLSHAGFSGIRQVPELGIFNDYSYYKLLDKYPISLNVIAQK